MTKYFSPTDQLKLKALKIKLENRDKDLYLISVNTQNLYREFIEFLEKVIDSNEFIIYKLYQNHNIEEQINTIQFHRDGLVDDEKGHIFLVDRDEWNLFTSKGDLFSKIEFKEEFIDNSSASDIESDYFDTQEIYAQAKEYEQKHQSWDSEQKRAVAREIAFNAHRLMQHELSLKYFLILVPFVKELNDAILEAMCYYFIGMNYRNLNQYSEALEYYEKALKLYMQENEQEDIATIYDELGYIYKVFNQFDKAKEYYHRAIDLNEKLGFYDDLAESYTHLGVLYSERGLHRESVGYYQKSKAIHQKHNNPVGVADNLNNIGLAYYLSGYFVESLAPFNQSLELYDKERNIVEIASVVGNIGMAYYDMADWQKALENHQKALAIYEQFHIEENMAKSYGNIGLVYFKQHKIDETIEYFEKGLALHKKLDERDNIYHDYNNLSLAYMKQEKYEKAIEMLENVLDYAKELNNPHQEATIYLNLGGVYLKQDKNSVALEYFHKALTQAQNSELLLARCHHNLAQTYLLKGELHLALEHVESAIDLNEELENIESQAFEYKIEGQIYTQLQKYEKALKSFNESMRRIEAIDDKKEFFGIYYAVGTAYQHLGRYSEAIEIFEKALPLVENEIARVDTLLSLGISFIHVDEAQKATEYLGQTYELAKEIGYDEVVGLLEREFV